MIEMLNNINVVQSGLTTYLISNLSSVYFNKYEPVTLYLQRGELNRHTCTNTLYRGEKNK